MQENKLKVEFEYYLTNQDKFLLEYPGKFIVIKDKKVIGSYDSEIEAYQDSQKNHELGTFLIQHVQPGSESYTQTFYSQMSL